MKIYYALYHNKLRESNENMNKVMIESERSAREDEI